MIKNSYREILSALEYVKDMRGLVIVLNEALNRNIIESVSGDVQNTLDRVPIDQNIRDLVNVLSWGVALSPENSNTTLEMLIRLSNRICDEFETFVMDPSDMVLSTAYICSDHRSDLVNKLSDEQKFNIVRFLSHFIENADEEYLSNPEGKSQYITILNLLSQGKNCDEVLSLIPTAGMDIAPLVIGLGGIATGNDVRGTITKMICEHVQDSLNIQKIAIAGKLSQNSGNVVSENEARWFVGSILWDLSAFANSMSRNPSVPMPSAEVGELIWRLFSDIRGFYQVLGADASRVPSNLISETMLDCYRNLICYHEMNTFVASTIYEILTAYAKDSSDGPWFSGDYLKSIKLYLDRDPSFKMFCEEIDQNATTRLVLDTDEDAYKTMIYRFLDPTIAEHLITTEASRRTRLDDREAELDARERELERREKRLSKNRDDYNDDDEEEPEEDQNPEDRPEIDARQSTKGYHKSSKTVADGTRKIYGAWHKFKMNESRVDSQLDKMITSMKTAFKGGDKTEAILSGKRWTPIGILKQALKTAAVFSFSKIGGIVYLVTTIALDKKRTEKQKRQILGELDTEIQLIDEKIDDAKGDGNRQAKYALMRTKGELERARDKIRYNLSASAGDLKTAKDLIINKRYGGGR